jgi:uncharacterized membrane protein SpoIIM required for sporulation/energy-converting hydrogenase Eha subunit E
MVLERLVSIRAAVRQPAWMFLIGGIVSVTCLAISFLIFETSIGLFTTFLITFAMTPFMLNLVIRQEEIEEDKKEIEKLNILQRHKDILKVYAAFFAGMILSLSIIYLILPEHIVEKLFQDQINEIKLIRGSFLFFNTFQKILMNNLSVLFLSFLFSFIFGAGAVFILAWNASVLSAAIGMAAKSIGGFKALPLAVLMFFPHGSLEILAYFIGGIAGGLVSAAIVRRRSPRFSFILKDSFQLIGISVLLLVLAALIEGIQLSI